MIIYSFDPSPEFNIACLMPSWKTFLFVRLGVVLLAAGLQQLYSEPRFSTPAFQKRSVSPNSGARGFSLKGAGSTCQRASHGWSEAETKDLQCSLGNPRICNIAEKSMEPKVPETLAPHGCSNVCCRCSAATLDLFSGGLSTSSKCTSPTFRQACLLC